MKSRGGRVARLALASCAAAVVSLTALAPAHAAESPQAGSFAISPAPGAGGVVATTAAVTASGEFHTKAGSVIRSISVTMRSLADPPAMAEHTVWICRGSGDESCGARSSVTFTKPLEPVTRNGPYEISAKATGAEQFDVDGEQAGSATPVTVRFRVPPASPSDFRAAAARGDAAVTLSWNRNREADIINYVPIRQNANGSFSALEAVEQPSASTSRLTTRDRNPGRGNLKYWVFAMRSAGEPGVAAIKSATGIGRAVQISGQSTPTTTPATTPPPSTPSNKPPAAMTPPQAAPPPTPGPRPVAPPPDLDFGSLPTPIVSVGSGGSLSGVGNGTGDEVGINVDDGAFDETLPYGELPKRPSAGFAAPRALPMRPVMAPPTDRKAMLIPLAAGAALCVFGFQLRWLNSRVPMPADLV